MDIYLRPIRIKRLMTQGELAERAGISRAIVSRIENGRQRARISTVRKLAIALDVPPEVLLTPPAAMIEAMEAADV